MSQVTIHRIARLAHGRMYSSAARLRVPSLGVSLEMGPILPATFRAVAISTLLKASSQHRTISLSRFPVLMSLRFKGRASIDLLRHPELEPMSNCKTTPILATVFGLMLMVQCVWADERHLFQIIVREQGIAQRLYEFLAQQPRTLLPEKFKEMATTFCKDGDTATVGGDLGRIGRNAFFKSTADLIFELPNGGLSRPIQSDSGWSLFFIVDVYEGFSREYLSTLPSIPLSPPSLPPIPPVRPKSREERVADVFATSILMT